jgi:hypothetical protein
MLKGRTYEWLLVGHYGIMLERYLRMAETVVDNLAIAYIPSENK